MNVQELLTYVEELTFKTSMFGYDKDEVDIQLDKICDEVEAIVKTKDQEIAKLKDGDPVGQAAEDAQAVMKEDLIGEGSEEEVLKQQLAKMKERLQAAEEREAAAKQQAAEAEERAIEAEKKAAAAEGKAAVAQSKAAAEAEKAPVTKDEAYEQYLKNADLLCKQLSDLQSRQDSIVAEARIEADKVLSDAKVQAEQMIAEANVKAAQMNQESEEIRKESLNKVKEEEKQCEELREQKRKLAETLHALTTDIQQLIDKAQA